MLWLLRLTLCLCGDFAVRLGIPLRLTRSFLRSTGSDSLPVIDQGPGRWAQKWVLFEFGNDGSDKSFL